MGASQRPFGNIHHSFLHLMGDFTMGQKEGKVSGPFISSQKLFWAGSPSLSPKGHQVRPWLSGYRLSGFWGRQCHGFVCVSQLPPKLTLNQHTGHPSLSVLRSLMPSPLPVPVVLCGYTSRYVFWASGPKTSYLVTPPKSNSTPTYSFRCYVAMMNVLCRVQNHK